MTYIKIDEKLIPAEISGFMTDRAWDNRESKAITLEMSHAEANELFVDGLPWSIVMDVEKERETVQEDGTVVTEIVTTQEEYDNSEFCVAGDITDHRDGTLTVKMGKFTVEEMLLMEVLA